MFFGVGIGERALHDSITDFQMRKIAGKNLPQYIPIVAAEKPD